MSTTTSAGTVTSAERIHVTPDAPDNAWFRVLLRDGRCVLARRSLLTTGLVDELPDVPGLAQRWGRDVIHCPYWHGREWRDQPLAVVGTGPTAVQQALLFRQWSADVTPVRTTGPEPDEEQRERMSTRSIPEVPARWLRSK